MISPVCRNELPECVGLIRAAFGTVAAEFNLTPRNCASNGAFMTLERLEADFSRGCEMFAARENGAITGFLQLTDNNDGSYELEKLAVSPQSRHAGTGARLVEFAKAAVLERGGKGYKNRDN